MRKIYKVFRLAIRSLLQHKLRTALSILGIVCGVMSVLTMLSIGEGAKREVLSQIEQLGMRNIYVRAISLTQDQQIKATERLSRGLSSYDRDRILKGCPLVDEVASLNELTVSVTGVAKDITTQVMACSPNYAPVQKLAVFRGRFIADEDINCKNMVCVLGDTVADSLGASGKPGSDIRIGNHTLKVVGVLKRYNMKTTKSSVVSMRNYNEIIFVPLGTEGMIKQAAYRRGGSINFALTQLVIQIRKTEDVLKAANMISRIMEISHGGVEDYQMVIPQQLLAQSRRTQRTFNIVLGSIACIALLVGGIGIMNIMLATISERTREIGIRRAVGAAREHIMIQFLAESVILTFFGGIVGVAAGMVGVWLITVLAGWQTAITFWSLFVPLLLSILVGIFFGLYPAYHAAKMDPIAALRND